MDINDFIKKTPFLYHLTDRRNLPLIITEGKLLSTNLLVQRTNLNNKEEVLKIRRPEHTELVIDGKQCFIRDQRPLNKALDKCLTDGWTREQYIYHLNDRVFTWPTLKRLNIHYGRYESEKPIILRLRTDETLNLNTHGEITHINSGATRPSGALEGKAAARGKDTFKAFEQYTRNVSSVAEVTFPNFCSLPKTFWKGTNPEGQWMSISL
jgi:hypothetical protein